MKLIFEMIVFLLTDITRWHLARRVNIRSRQQKEENTIRNMTPHTCKHLHWFTCFFFVSLPVFIWSPLLSWTKGRARESNRKWQNKLHNFYPAKIPPFLKRTKKTNKSVRHSCDVWTKSSECDIFYRSARGNNSFNV